MSGRTGLYFAWMMAVIVALAQDWADAATLGTNQHSRGLLVKNNPPVTLANRAAQSGVSPSTQRRADTLAKASPELAKQVGRRGSSPSQRVRRARDFFCVRATLVTKKIPSHRTIGSTRISDGFLTVKSAGNACQIRLNGLRVSLDVSTVRLPNRIV